MRNAKRSHALKTKNVFLEDAETLIFAKTLSAKKESGALAKASAKNKLLILAKKFVNQMTP